MNDLEKEFAQMMGREDEFTRLEMIRNGLPVLAPGNKSDYTEGASFGIHTPDNDLIKAIQFGNVIAQQILDTKNRIRKNIMMRASRGIPTSETSLRELDINVNEYIITLKKGVETRITELEKLKDEGPESHKSAIDGEIEKFRSITDQYNK